MSIVCYNRVCGIIQFHDARVGENLEFTRNLREIYEKKTSEVDLGVVKDKGGGDF